MVKPRFSVIIPTLNEEKFLPKLLTSLARQTVKNFDVVVVDGHSQDRTVEVARKFTDKLPLTVVTGDKGVSKQRNMGARIGKADCLVFVDADSVLLSNFIERIGMYIDRKHPKFFTTWLKADKEDPVHDIAGLFFNLSIEAGIVMQSPWAPGPLTVVRRKEFEMVGGYNEKVTYGEDHELGVSIYERGIPFTILREILYIYNFRRYRKEKLLKILDRSLKSTVSVALTRRGLARMPGFVSGGLMYNEKRRQKEHKKVVVKDLERRIKKIIDEITDIWANV